MNIALYVIAGLTGLSAFLTVAFVGKPRKPIEPGLAAFTIAWNAVIVVVLILAARRLG